MKPLFIPLKTEYFDAFANGTKDTERRVFGKRWNAETCQPGRPVVLSKGYGKRSRLYGHIESFSADLKPQKFPGWVECYGDDPSLVAACIKIKLSTTEKGGQ